MKLASQIKVTLFTLCILAIIYYLSTCFKNPLQKATLNRDANLSSDVHNPSLENSEDLNHPNDLSKDTQTEHSSQEDSADHEKTTHNSHPNEKTTKANSKIYSDIDVAHPPSIELIRSEIAKNPHQSLSPSMSYFVKQVTIAMNKAMNSEAEAKLELENFESCIVKNTYMSLTQNCIANTMRIGQKYPNLKTQADQILKKAPPAYLKGIKDLILD